MKGAIKRSWILLACLIVVLSLVLGTTIWFFSRSSDIYEVAARYRAAGLPFERGDLAGENSPGVDVAFVQQLTEPSFEGFGQWTSVDVRNEVIDWGVIEKDLARIDGLLSQFEQLVGAESIDFGSDLDDWQRTNIEVSHFYSACDAFELRARMKVRQGDLDSALKDLRTRAGLSRVFCSSDYYRQMVSRGLMRRVIEGGLRIAGERKDDPDWVRQIAIEIERFEQAWSFEGVVRGVMYRSLAGARSERLVDPVSLMTGQGVFVETNTGVIREPFGRGSMNRNWVKAQLELSLEWDDVLKMDDLTLVEMGQELDRRTQDAIVHNRVSSLTIEYWSPDWLGFAESLARTDNMNATAGLALRVWEYRLLNGRLPADLGETGVPVPLDPVSQQPIKFAEVNGMVVVYDFGYDGIEDLDDRNAYRTVRFPMKPLAIKDGFGIPGVGR